MVADDEPELLEIMEAYLTRMGFEEVLVAKNGKEALVQMQSRSIDCLVTEVRMPVMDGVSLVRSIAQLRLTLPIVFVGGFGEMDEEGMRALGVVAFMSKPCSQMELKNVLQRALAGRRAAPFHTTQEPADV